MVASATTFDEKQSSSSSSHEQQTSLVLNDLRHYLTGVEDGEAVPHNETNDDDESNHVLLENEHRSDVALPVAAIKTLLGVIKRSTANTMMGLQADLRKASDDMIAFVKSSSPNNSLLLGGRSHIALASGCELFLKYVTRAFLELPDFAACIAQVLERGERFADISVHSRDRIAELGQAFVQDGQTVLTHGWSRVVSALLIRAATVHNKHFSLVILEGRPDAGGIKAAKLYADAGIPTTVVLDSAMGHAMESVDLVIVGAEGVVENGGIVNKIGTFPLGIVAREMGKPFYVAAESYKFARLFPLNQRDLPDMGGGLANLHFVDTTSWHATATTAQKAPPHRDESMDERERETVRGLVHLPDHVNVENPICDYTPAKYITLLFTDLGVLTPSAVSDELIRLYQ